jgi:spermidine synthase
MSEAEDGSDTLAADGLVEKREENGGVIELHRRGMEYDVIVEGRTIMSTDVRRSERSLAELALAPWAGRDDLTILVGGLGMGFLARAFLESAAVARVDIVEASQAIIDWEAKYFGGIAKDPRVHIHHADLAGFLGRAKPLPAGWLVLALDTDDFPYTLARPENAALYSDDGLRLLEDGLRPGGVLTIWATEKNDDLFKRMWGRFQNVLKIGVPVDVRGHSSIDYVYRGRRVPSAAHSALSN